MPAPGIHLDKKDRSWIATVYQYPYNSQQAAACIFFQTIYKTIFHNTLRGYNPIDNEIKEYLHNKGIRDEMAEELSNYQIIRIQKSAKELSDILRKEFGNP